MSKKNVKKKRKTIRGKLLLCGLVVLLIVGGYFGYTKFYSKTTVKAPKVVDEIKSFGYVVNDKDTKLFKTTFNELKKVLNKKEVDKKEYATNVAKLFVIDFFSLQNKSSKNDVGGVQFVYSKFKTDFVDLARYGMYKQVSNTIEDSGKQNLPLVKSVKVSSVDEIDPTSVFSNYQSQDENKGYEVKLTWEYDSDQGFQKSATVTVVSDGDKLSVAKMEE